MSQRSGQSQACQPLKTSLCTLALSAPSSTSRASRIWKASTMLWQLPGLLISCAFTSDSVCGGRARVNHRGEEGRRAGAHLLAEVELGAAEAGEERGPDERVADLHVHAHGEAAALHRLHDGALLSQENHEERLAHRRHEAAFQVNLRRAFSALLAHTLARAHALSLPLSLTCM